MIKKLLEWWVVNDPLPNRADVIAIISYGATNTDLTVTSLNVLDEAKRISRRYPEAIILWGVFPKNLDKSLEKVAKIIRLRGYQRHLFVGEVSSTTDECEAMRRKLLERGLPIKSVIVVGDGSHSRRAKRVWVYFFPNSRICFRSVDPKLASDPNNPMIFQRKWWVWFLVNLTLYPLYLGNGVKRMAKINLSQPAS